MRSVTKTATLVAVVLLLGWGASAEAMPFHMRFVVVPRGYLDGPALFDPWWNPYTPYGPYPSAVIPIGTARRTADFRMEVTPKQARVYVDGDYAGAAGDFDGFLKRLPTSPGAHAVTLYLDGYRTVTKNVYVGPGATYKLRETMDKLTAGEASTPPPAPSHHE
jgi:hypothetical protein